MIKHDCLVVLPRDVGADFGNSQLSVYGKDEEGELEDYCILLSKMAPLEMVKMTQKSDEDRGGRTTE